MNNWRKVARSANELSFGYFSFPKRKEIYFLLEKRKVSKENLSSASRAFDKLVMLHGLAKISSTLYDERKNIKGVAK